MPLGGRLKIELGTTVVDRHFVARHPNVRLGSARSCDGDGKPARDPNRRASAPSRATKPGRARAAQPIQTRLDLGALQELVGHCGGHLWMTVEPAGDTIVKIRLPLVTAYGEPPRRSRRVPSLARWFQH